MKSTGEVMGIDRTFERALYKALLGAGTRLPESGKVFVSVKDDDKPAACEIARRLVEAGFAIVATRGTVATLGQSGIPAELVLKVAEGRPDVVDLLKSGQIAMVLNTTVGRQAIRDSYSIRRQTLVSGIPYFTTIAAAAAATQAIEERRDRPVEVRSLQEFYES
jgi:carbamoyl-phosphate synthase large subunit